MEIIYLLYIFLFVSAFLTFSVINGFVHQNKTTSITVSKQHLSLIIAARDEEKNIGFLIDSIENQKYPLENCEIIIVDDNSSDKTSEIISSRIKGKINYFLIEASEKKYSGKKGALQVGIENSRNDFIVITDADCKPESGWLSKISCAFENGYDFVFGVAPIRSGSLFVEKLSAFENLRNTFLSISAVGLNIPYSAAARSFAFRKSAFDKVGGYSNTTETLSGDDDLLLREAVKHKMKIGTVLESDAFVFSDPPKTFTEYFRQKKRHLQTSFHYLLKQKLFLGFWHLINLISLFSILLMFWNPFFALPFITKLVMDFFIVITNQNTLGHSFKFYEIIYLQIVFEVFIVINFFNSLFGKVEWK